MKKNLILTSCIFALLGGNLIAQKDPIPVRDGGMDEFVIAPKPFYLPNSLVKPPIPGWDVAKSLYSVPAGKGGTFQYKSGTSVYIPKDAFVDEQGRKVIGDVQIDYREFQDPLDFVFSGIPMTYDSGGQTHTFESAGMFDIAASQNGKQVFLAKNKTLKMDFASSDDRTSFNFYELDEKKGTWTNKGKTSVPVKIALEKRRKELFSSAVYEFLSFRRNKSSLVYYDTTRLENRFRDTAYAHYLLKYPVMMKLINSEGIAERYTGENKEENGIRLTRTRSGRNGEIAFMLNLSYRSFPEMRAFAGKRWVVTDPESRSTFRSKYGSRNAFSDVRIEPSGNGYELVLKSEKGFVVLHAYPISPSLLKKKEHTAVNTSKATAQYRKSLARRCKSFNHDLVKSIKMNRKKNKEASEQTYWASLKREMIPAERQMGFVAWQNYCNDMEKKEKELVLNSAADETTIIRSLQLDGMGVFNCDQIQRLSNPIVAHAKYQGTNGLAMKTTATYIIDNKINGVLRYDGYLGYSPSKIAYSAESDNLLITIREDGKVAYADKQSFRVETAKNSTKPDFVMADVDPAKMSVAEFRKVLGLK
jgi:hypothetical protein